MSEESTIIQLQASAQEPGRFEVVTISAGVGNGLTFPPAVLQTSVPLWSNTSAFVNHDASRARKVEQFCGILQTPQWDASAQAIRATLVTTGPMGPTVDTLAREMLANPDLPIPIGLSADVDVVLDGTTVTRIVHVASVDVVHKPARGGKFTRALNGEPDSADTQGDLPMSTPNETQGAQTAANAATPPAVDPNLEAARRLLQIQSEQERQAAAQAEQDKILVSMCDKLLESSLLISKLPEPARAHVRAQFSGRIFQATELDTAINAVREMLAASQQVVTGAGRVNHVIDSADALQAAVDDMLGAPRTAQMQNASVHRLSGIRELYHLLTGDHDLHGGYYPERAQLQHTTATFTGLVKNALNKSVVAQWEALGRAGYDWWMYLAKPEHFNSLNDITWTLFGSVGTLPVVSEGHEYTELATGDSPETATFYKYGGYLGITLEAIDRDETRKLRDAPRELANAGMRNISSLVAALFTANSGVGPTLADTGALFNATAVTTAGGHANLLTTAFSATAWDAVARAMYAQPMLIRNETGLYGTGSAQAVEPSFCLVPRALKGTAEDVFLNSWKVDSNVHAENLFKGVARPLVVPEWTDTTDWAAAADPNIIPGIGIGERFGIMPEIYIAGDENSPAVFSNDEFRVKVRHYVAVGIQNWRALHKSNV